MDPAAVNSASKARRTAGMSAAGSAWHVVPPIVPLFLTCLSPTCRAASESMTQLCSTRGETATSLWVVIEPIRRWPLSFLM